MNKSQIHSVWQMIGVMASLFLSLAIAKGAGMEYRHSVERDIRMQLASTLTPIVGADNFVVTVQVTPVEEEEEVAAKKKPRSILVDGKADVYKGLYPLGKLGVWSAPEFDDDNKVMTKKKKSSFEIANIKVDLFLDSSLSPQQKADARNVASVFLGTFGEDKVALNDISIALNQTKKREERERLRQQEEMESRLRKAANVDAQRFKRAALRAELEMKKDLALQIEKLKAEERRKERLEMRELERKIASEAKQQKTPLELLSDFQLPVGLVAAALILFVLGFFAMMRFQGLAERKVTLMEEAAKREESEAIHSNIEGDQAASVIQEEIQVEMTEHEVDEMRREFTRFSTLCQDNLPAAVTLVRQWTQSDKREPKIILSLLPRYVEVTKINTVVHHLNQNEKKIWSKIITTPKADLPPRRIIDFLSVQMTNSVLVPVEQTGDGNVDLIMGLSSEEAAEVIRRNPEFAKIILNVLPTGQVAGILRTLDTDQLEYGAGSSLTFHKDDISLAAGKLNELIQQVLRDKRQVTSPFLDQIPTLIREVGPETEGPLFRVLSEANLPETLVELAHEVFPAELLFELSDTTVRRVLEQMSLKKRAELFISQDGDIKDHFMGILGEGSKLAEIMNTEMEDIAADPNKVTHLKKDGVKMWRDFIRLTRNFIRANESVQAEVQGVVDKWLVEKMGVDDGVIQNIAA